ncbi:cubilin-like isoform X2 [Tachypleus tridentatus]|uniref:cubilin-like isoform X2 n=1 Tax=Tachypleus tridentatus TaxID=6853 RepID=UPI003FD4A62D
MEEIELAFMYLDVKIRLSKKSLGYLLIIFYYLLLVKEVNAEIYYCDEEIRSHDAELQSPNFPWSYPPNLQCQYSVYRASPEVCKLAIHILYFRLENSFNCFNDHLFLEDKFYCGGMLRSNQVTDQQSESCDIRILSPRSHLRSPGYPWAYPPNLQCRYTIEKFRPDVCQVEVTVLDFHLRYSRNCTSDYLCTCKDGIRLCGKLPSNTTYVYNVPSMEKNFCMYFQTSEFGTDKGFELFIRQITDCYPRTPRTSGSTSMVTTTTTMKPTTPYKELTITTDITKSTSEQMKITDKISTTSEGLTTTPTMYTTTPTDHPICYYYLQDRAGNINSPQYPRNYPNNLDCTYLFTRNNDRDICRLKLTLLDFDLEDSVGCFRDYFEVGGKRYCGRYSHKIIDAPFTSSSIWISARFVTDLCERRRGFQIQYMMGPCLTSTSVVTEQKPTAYRNTTTVEPTTTSERLTTTREISTTPGEITTTREISTTPGEITTTREISTTPGGLTTTREISTTPGGLTTTSEIITTSKGLTTTTELITTTAVGSNNLLACIVANVTYLHEDCDKYYYCNENLESTLHQCPPGELVIIENAEFWNIFCTDEAEVDCVDRKRPAGSKYSKRSYSRLQVDSGISCIFDPEAERNCSVIISHDRGHPIFRTDCSLLGYEECRAQALNHLFLYTSHASHQFPDFRLKFVIFVMGFLTSQQIKVYLLSISLF